MAKKIKLTDENFQEFKKMFNRYADKYGLDGWDIYFSFESQDKLFAKTRLNYINHVATIILSTECDSADVCDIDTALKETAKHEVIYILIGQLTGLMNDRYLSGNKVTEAEKSLVIKLQKLL